MTREPKHDGACIPCKVVRISVLKNHGDLLKNFEQESDMTRIHC